MPTQVRQRTLIPITIPVLKKEANTGLGMRTTEGDNSRSQINTSPQAT
jgi:hypothetical protein